MVVSICSAKASPRPLSTPSACALSADKSAKPMFVGDVRCAVPVGGWVCTLSGGR